MDNIQLNIPIEDAKDFLALYIEKRKSFMVEHESIFSKMKEYDSKIKKLQELLGIDKKQSGGDSHLNGSLFKNVPSAYPIVGSWNQKIQFFLRENANGLTARQIKDMVIAKEKTKKDDEGRVNIGVSATLSVGEKKGNLYKKIKSENGENLYVLA
jgi:hypothetical protein